MKRNRYPGTCRVCGRQVEADAGYLTGDGLRHTRCMRPRPATHSENLAGMIQRQERDAESLALQRRAESVASTIAILFLLPRAARCDLPLQH